MCSMLFYSSVSRYIFCVSVLFSVLLYSFSVLLYSSVLLCCSLLFILLCSSSCCVCVLDCIYCILTLPPGVNPIAANKHLSIRVRTANRPDGSDSLNRLRCGNRYRGRNVNWKDV
jgi:hypothetical protein